MGEEYNAPVSAACRKTCRNALLYNAGETAEVRSKRCHYSQTSPAQSSPQSTPFLHMVRLLTGSHHSPVISTPFIFSSNSSILPTPSSSPPLLLPTCTRARGNRNQMFPFSLAAPFILRIRFPPHKL